MKHSQVEIMIGTPGWALICIGVIAIIWRLTELSRLTAEVEATRKTLEQKQRLMDEQTQLRAAPEAIALGDGHDDYDEDDEDEDWEEDDEDSPTTLFGHNRLGARISEATEDAVDRPTTMMPRAPLWRQ